MTDDLVSIVTVEGRDFAQRIESVQLGDRTYLPLDNGSWRCGSIRILAGSQFHLALTLIARMYDESRKKPHVPPFVSSDPKTAAREELSLLRGGVSPAAELMAVCTDRASAVAALGASKEECRKLKTELADLTVKLAREKKQHAFARRRAQDLNDGVSRAILEFGSGGAQLDDNDG